MFEIGSEGESARDRRSTMYQFWLGALARLEGFIARENRSNEAVADRQAPPEGASGTQ
jgi:hypothetical protein